MEYALLLFLDGVITFISPCLLPMLPIYISYFAGGSGRSNALKNALGFVLGFTVVFVSLGAFAGLIGGFLRTYSTAVNMLSGLIVILFGLNYLGVWRIGFLNRTVSHEVNVRNLGFFSSVLFGVVFSVGWTPCVSAFLGQALLLAAQKGTAGEGILLLLAYSLGLGVPFVASAVLINRLKFAFDFMKRHYLVINRLSGGLLVLVGILMMTGTMGYFLSLLTV
ncbi:MAG: cytochrome c biogenesis protein CcdA [Clostridiales bacterium]|nr:cytochrome c biogenesis protein CcdA [Clostridiales bacterium]